MMIPDSLHPLGRRSWRTTPPSPLPYDAEVEYLESTGTQWIDTGIGAGSGQFSMSFMSTAVTASWAYALGGTYAGNAQERLLVFWHPTVQKWSLDTGLSAAANRIGDSGVRIDIPKTAYAIPSGFAHTVVAFGNRTNSGSVAVNASVRLYALSFWDANGNLVRDFIPVRVGSGADAVGYLYDRANPTGGPSGNGLYGNAGTGAFAIGPDKSP